MDELKQLREEIDQIDEELLTLFLQRIEVVKKIGQYKKVNKLPIIDLVREQAVLTNKKIKLNDPKIWPLYERFITLLMTIAKEVQSD